MRLCLLCLLQFCRHLEQTTNGLFPVSFFVHQWECVPELGQCWNILPLCTLCWIFNFCTKTRLSKMLAIYSKKLWIRISWLKKLIFLDKIWNFGIVCVLCCRDKTSHVRYLVGKLQLDEDGPWSLFITCVHLDHR